MSQEAKELSSEISELEAANNILDAREAIISTEEAKELAYQEEIAKHETEVEEKQSALETESSIHVASYEKIPDNHIYAKYGDVDKEQLQRDLEEIKANLGDVINKMNK